VPDTAVSFRVETLFGATTRWLSSAGNPEIDLGDASLVLVAPGAESSPAPGKPATLELRRTDEDGWRSFPLDALPLEVDGLKISLVRAYEQAIVNAAGNGMSEGGAHGLNPALELSVASQGQTVSEVLYAKFPDFTLSPSGIFGHKLRYAPALAPAPRTGNIIECQVDPGAPDKVRMRLLKLGTELVSQDLRPGETLSTPWSGIQLTLGGLVLHAMKAEDVQSVEPRLGRKRPPAAVEVLPAGAPPEHGLWLVEGDSRSLPGIGDVRFGPPRLKLPMRVALKPSESAVAETAMEVTPPGLTVRLRPGASALVNGYRFMVDERPAVLRITRDPGQPLLYVGSIGLLVGLISLARARRAVT
jgi:hypothetical protein